MMKKIIMVAICMAVATVTGIANAHEEDTPGWRVGVNAVTTKLKRDDDIINDTSLGFRLHAQYKFNSWLGVEGSFFNSLDLSTDAIFADDTAELVYKGPMVQVIGYIPLPMDDIEIFLKAGYFDFDVKLTRAGVNQPGGSDSGAVVGLGASFHISDSVHFTTAFDWYSVEAADLFTIGLGAEYHF